MSVGGVVGGGAGLTTESRHIWNSRNVLERSAPLDTEFSEKEMRAVLVSGRIYVFCC